MGAVALKTGTNIYAWALMTNHVYITLKVILGKERGSRRKGSLSFCLWSSPLLSMVCRRACHLAWNRACHPASGQDVPEAEPVAEVYRLVFRPV